MCFLLPFAGVLVGMVHGTGEGKDRERSCALPGHESQFAIQRHSVTDTPHLQAPAEDTSFPCFLHLTQTVLNLHCTSFFVTLTDVLIVFLKFFLLNNTLIILVQ